MNFKSSQKKSFFNQVLCNRGNICVGSLIPVIPRQQYKADNNWSRCQLKKISGTNCFGKIVQNRIIEIQIENFIYVFLFANKNWSGFQLIGPPENVAAAAGVLFWKASR